MLIAWIKIWMAVTNLAHSRQKVDVCRFASFSVRSLLCKNFWADSVDFKAEAKMRRLLGKVGRFFVRVKQSSFLGKLKRSSVKSLKCAGFWKNRARIGQKIQYADFKANSGGFSVRNKCLDCLSKPMRFSVRNLNMQIVGQNWGFFW